MTDINQIICAHVPIHKFPDGEISAEDEFAIDAKNSGNFTALEPWVREWVAARDHVGELKMSLSSAHTLVEGLRLQLRNAEAAVVAETARVNALLPAALAASADRSELLKLAIGGLRDAMGSAAHWRYARSGRVVSANGELDLASATYAVALELRQQGQNI